jgi:GH24 family phage-related lysozyme (muramidase)
MISDKMLAKLRTVTPTSTALSVEEMSDTIKGINEAKPVNPVKREDCPDVTSTVPVPRPKPRPANLGGANSGIRVPIPTPRPKPRPANLGTSSTAAKSVAGLSASKKGLDLIAEMEGSAPYFYSDHGIPAIGNGVQINSEKELRQLCRNFKLNCAVAKQSWLRIKRGQRADKKKLLSKSQIRTLLKQKIVRYENTVKKVFRGTGVDLNQNQFDALVSLAFNYPRAFKDPRLRIYKAMKAGRLNDVALEMGDIGPKQGHYKRRLREINLFLLGVASIDPRKMPSNAPSDPEHRKVYKKLKKFWISRAGKGRTFWQSNPEYRFFMKRF